MKFILTLITYLIPSFALAEDASASPGLESLIFQLGIIFAIFYFLLIRPQQKKYKAHTQMVLGLKKGDKVLTSGGFVGSVTKAVEGDRFVEVEIADNVVVKVLRSTITELVTEKTADKK